MFEDRQDAGRKLALKISRVASQKDFIVVALARGGVALGKVIADYFGWPLEVIVIKKIGAPHNPELAIGAVGPKKTIYWDKQLVKYFALDKSFKSKALKEKTEEIEKLEKILRMKSINFTNKKIVLVDDGVATGASAICAAKFFQKDKAQEVILAIPVISKDIFSYINKHFDRVIALRIVNSFSSVGEFYKYFPQVSNEEMVEILNSKSI